MVASAVGETKLPLTEAMTGEPQTPRKLGERVCERRRVKEGRGEGREGMRRSRGERGRERERDRESKRKTRGGGEEKKSEKGERKERKREVN